METLKILVVVGYWCETTFAQFCFDLRGVPRRDAPAEAIKRSETWTRNAVTISRWRWRLIPAPKHETAPVADVEHRLLAIVAADLPIHECRVERRFLGIVHDLTGEVIEQNGLPSRWLEGKFGWRGVTLRSARARTAALSLSERRHRLDYHGDTERR